MKLISIITPVLGTKAQHLAQAARSVAQQELPEGWSYEWLVQQDGPDGDASRYLPDQHDPHLSFQTSTQWGGQAVARNLALSRANGDLIKVLDADDLFTDNALARDIATFDAEPAIAWTVARSLNLMPDGSTSCYIGNPPPGIICRGALLDHWESHQEPQIHPASLCVRRDILTALGGWMAVSTSEDTGLLLALNAVSAGAFIGEPGLYHRRWDGQTTVSRTDDADRHATMRFLGARARALATMLGRALH